MAKREFSIRIEADELKEAIRKFPTTMARYIRGAGREAGAEVIETEGLQQYPPETEANRPPAPYYERGLGTVYASGRSDKSSENFGKQWTIRPYGKGVRIGNSASYAEYVSGRKQPLHMHRKGWRKLHLVARAKLNNIKRIYENAINKALRRVGLR